MTPRKGQLGICKLTGTSCKLVKSHLIPRALTPPRPGGIGFPQFGGRQRPSRRFDSWYDTQLVGRKGEDVLTSLDTFAVSELRRRKLVWQSFGPMRHLSTPEYESIPGTPYGVRRVVFGDALRMRLFFLSLLWRAAATDRPEFAEVSLTEADLAQLRDYVRDHVQTIPSTFFPITLTQIATVGLYHNHVPITRIKKPVAVDGNTSKPLPYFRFFLNGLVAHVHLSADDELVDSLFPMLVGPAEGTTVSTVDWDQSWQFQNLVYTIADADHEFPGELARADGLRRSS